jgi:uncharacterized membrane protein
LIAVSVFAAMAMTLTFRAPESSPARLLVTLPLALFLPGYALAAALFPGRGLGVPEKLLLSFGLSLAVVVFGGLLLQWTSLGLRPAAWAALLGNITLLASFVALLRCWHRPVAETAVVRLTPMQGLQLALAMLLVVGAVQLARDGAAQRRDAGFTQLWMLPAGDARPDALRLGIGNHEARPMRYKLQVNAGATVVDEWSPITIEPDQQWEMVVTLPAAPPGSPAIEAVLYRLDAPGTVYRHAVFWRGQREG